MEKKVMLGEEDSFNKSFTINAATETIISLAQHRKSIYLRNVSTGGQVITLGFSNFTPVVAGTGYVLNVNDFIIDANGESYKCWSGKIRAISSAIGGTLAVVEMNEDTS